MNISESSAIAEKLNGLISAAEEFGSQSEQLTKVRNAFDAYVTSAAQTEKQMIEVVEKCNEYIQLVYNVVEKDYSERITPTIESTVKAASDCQEQFEQVTAEYKNALHIFEEQKEYYEKKQEEMASLTETAFEKEAELIRRMGNALEAKASSRFKSLTESENLANEELSQTILSVSKELAVRIGAVQKKNDFLSLEMEAIKTELEASKMWRAKKELQIRIGVIAAGIAALASIVGLFI